MLHLHSHVLERTARPTRTRNGGHSDARDFRVDHTGSTQQDTQAGHTPSSFDRRLTEAAARGREDRSLTAVSVSTTATHEDPARSAHHARATSSSVCDDRARGLPRVQRLVHILSTTTAARHILDEFISAFFQGALSQKLQPLLLPLPEQPHDEQEDKHEQRRPQRAFLPSR